MLFVWAFDKEENPNKANWAKANLLFIAGILAIFIAFIIILLAAGALIRNQIGA